MKKLSRKALNRSFRNWFYGHLTCFSQEHMQTFGYMLAMLPIVEDLFFNLLDEIGDQLIHQLRLICVGIVSRVF